MIYPIAFHMKTTADKINAEKVKVAPAKKTQKEYTGPKVEGEDF